MMTAGAPAPKVKIKNDEQVRKRKRKRPETEDSKNKKKKLKQLKDTIVDVKTQDKETEHAWSSINIENEKELMSMGLFSLEILDEADVSIQRPGKRKKKTAPKSNNKTDKPQAKKLQKLNQNNSSNVGKADKSSECLQTEESPSDQAVCNRNQPTKLSFAEKKERLKQKRKEKIAKTKLQRLENPDPEKERLRKEKVKAKRKARIAKKIQEKQLQSDVDTFIAEKTSALSDELAVISGNEPSNAVSSADSEKAETEIQSSEVLDIPATEVVQPDRPGCKESNSDGTQGEVESAAAVDPELPDRVREHVILTSEEKEKGKAWLDLDVCEPIVKGLLELGFTNPTPIQQACIPAGLLKYKDVIGAAETGSGKTLAFGIPLVQRIMRLKSENCLKGLVLCPTRELALQVTDHLKAATKYTGVRIVPIVGGIAGPKQQRLLSYKPPILVATPGRLWQLIQEHEYLQDLATVKFLVIDEADRMVEDGHFEEVTQIIGRLPGPEQRNAFLFSATLAFTIDRLDEKAKKKKKTKKERRAEKKGNAGLEMLVRNIGVKEKVEKVDFTLKKGTPELLTETYFLCNVEDKDLHLYYLLLNHPGRTLVFANSIDGVMNLVHIMKLLDLPIFPLHSSLQQRQRFKYLERFKECQTAVLMCTDIAARGLDIPEVDTVIHYQLPPTKEAYIHRSGRTARAENPGLSIAIVGPKDFKSYKKIASQMSEFPIENSRLRVLRPALGLARKIFKIERLQTRPEKKEAKLVALAKEAGLDDGETETKDTSESKREVKVTKAKLKVLLQQPVIDPLNSVRYATTKGAIRDFQTVSSFSLGVSALEHSKTKKKRSLPG